MVSNAPIRYVVFDVGGVLVRVLSWQEAHRVCGFPRHRIPTELAFFDEVSRLNHAYDSGALLPGEYNEAVVRASDCRYTATEVSRIHAAQLAGQMPGVDAVFDQLEQRGLPSALLSNTNPLHWESLVGDANRATYPALQRAAIRMASYEAKCAKPDPHIFALFEKRAGGRAADFLFFDDRLTNVEAAIAAGWRAEHVDTRRAVADQILEQLRRHGVLSGVRGMAEPDFA